MEKIYKEEIQVDDAHLTKKLRKIVKKQKYVFGLSQMLGLNVSTTHCVSNAPCTSWLCFGFACWGYACDHLACSGQQNGDCKNYQCADSACRSNAGGKLHCDKTQCSEYSCTEYACKVKSCDNYAGGLCESKVCKSEENGEPW